MRINTVLKIPNNKEMAWFLTEPLFFMVLFNRYMKLALSTTIRPYFTLSFICLFAITVLNSCKKENPGEKEIVKGEAKVKFINASQNAKPIDFYINDLKINSSSLVAGEGSDYISIESGIQTTKVNKEVNVLDVQTQFSYVPTLSYTSFFVEDRQGKGDILTFEDNLGAVEPDKARIRFVNLSPYFSNAINVSLGKDELLVNSLPFKEASSYFMIHAGERIGVSVLGTGTIKYAAGEEFEAGKNYTIWIGGSANSTLSINKITYN